MPPLEVLAAAWSPMTRAAERRVTRRVDNLVESLSLYLECGRSQDAAAKALSVHRSTLKYRLQRIGEISGHDLSDPDTSFNLQLAIRAWHTLTALRSASR